MLGELSNSGSMPALEEMVRFTAARHKIITHNIANLETPNFRAMDVSVTAFQKALLDAVRERRESTGGESGRFAAVETDEVELSSSGSIRLTPKTPSRGALGHDRNDADLESLMKDLAENQLAYRMASDLIRQQQGTLRTAISGRV
jgi:flagellar basal-body rod protein FlgB